MSDSKSTEELREKLDSLFCLACRKLHMTDRALELFTQELAIRVEEARIYERLHFANQMLGNDEWNIPSEVPDRPLLTNRLLEILEEEVATLNNQSKESRDEH